MHRIARLLLALLAFMPVAAFGQSAILQGGAWTYGHVPSYVSRGGQAVVQDGGPARGGDVNSGISELGMIAVGQGTAPYVGQASGPFGSAFCMYDAPISNAAGYHFLCLSPNATGNAGLISYGAGGAASTLPLNFNINGTSVVGVSCSGSPTSSFQSINGIVTHC